MRIVGHTQQREDLERGGSAVLLWGPSGIGKWLCARSYADDRGGAAISLRDGPTMEQAREMAALFRQRPISGSALVALVDLDVCSEAIQNVLLKTIEELPEWGKVILVGSQPVLPTIRSRCQVIEFRSLFPAEVEQVLVEDHGSSMAEGAEMAMMSNGSIGQALAVRAALRQKPVVLQFVDAVSRVDRVALTTMLPRWDDDAMRMLWRWTAEVIADYPRVFTKGELAVVHKMGVAKFYKLVECIKLGMPPDLAAMQVWKMR